MLGAAASSSSSPHRQTPGTTETSTKDTKTIPSEAKKPQTQLSGNRRKLPELDFSNLRRTASLNHARLENHFFRNTRPLRCHSLDIATEREISVLKTNMPSVINHFDMVDYLFDAYFGQDWKHSFSSISEGVKSFFETENKGVASALKMQVNHLASTPIDTKQLHPDLWLLEDFAYSEQLTLTDLVQTIDAAVEHASKTQA
jgi:hypothetical protein